MNRCLAEGRERFRSLISRGEDGRRCVEMRPLISAFCDGEAGPREVAELREHLRACGNCRATLRTYRAAPTAAALLPALPLQRSLLERAHEALANLAGRFGGGRSDAVTQVASGSGAGSLGIAGVAKVVAVCIGAAGGAAACAATGLVPGPLGDGGGHTQSVRQLHLVTTTAEHNPAVEYEPTPAADPSPPKPHPKQQPQPAPEEPEAAPAAAEPAPVIAEPVSGEAVESAPPPAPEPAAQPEPVAAPEGGSPAGEFGP